MKKYCIEAFWIYLIAFLHVQETELKPAVSAEEESSEESSISDISSSVEDIDGFDYDWTLESSGYTSYLDNDIPTQNPCPTYCTCVVESMVYCSRQNIVSVGGEGDDAFDTNSKVLSGNIHTSASAIHLGYNSLTYLPAGLFYNATQDGENNIREFYIQNNQIKTIDPDAFVVLTNLKNLDLSSNLLTSLIQNCSPFGTPSLWPIEAELQCDSTVKAANFLQSASSSLVSLNLNNNSIRGLPNYSFLTLPNLEVLRLSWNKISWISRKAFFGLHKLRILQLRGNPLDHNTASKLGDILQHFIKGEIQTPPDGNMLTELDSYQFYPQERDISGSISSRQIRSIRIVDLDSLHELDLGETNITVFPSRLPPSLKRLYLDSNRISSVPVRTLKGARQLEFLHLGGNRIERLKDRNFATMESLLVLDISRNNLTGFTPNSLKGLTGLISLRLYGNRHLSSLPRKVFWSLQSLRMLYIHDCNLKDLPSGPWMFRLMALWMYGNPIDCRCSNILSLMTRIFRRMRYSLRIDPYRSVLWDDSDTWKYQRPEKTTCASPERFKDLQLQEVPVEELRCTLEDHMQNQLSFQIASSRFISHDYQQDESTTVQNAETAQPENELNDVDLTREVSEVEIKFEAGHKEIEKLLAETDELLSEPDIVEPKFIPFSEDSATYKLSKESETTQDATAKDYPPDGTNRYSEDTFSEITSDLKEKERIREEDSTGTEWVISLPAGASIETEFDDVQEKLPPSDVVNNKPKEKILESFQDIKNSTLGLKENSALNLQNNSNENDIQSTAKDAFASDKTSDTEQRLHGQGYAEFFFYDDGDVHLEPELVSQFEDHFDSTLSESEKLRLKEEMDSLKGWKSYQDYYSDEGASGNDYEQSREEYEFALHVKNFVQSGSTFDDLLGNLSQIYNVSLPFDTTEIPFSDSLFDYDAY